MDNQTRQQRFRPADVVALVVIIGIFILRGFDIDVMLNSSILLILGYYFARREDTQVIIDRRAIVEK